MTLDSTLYEESYAAFLTEAQDILQRIEQDLLSLSDDRSPAKVHRLMRSAHTLKGAAASVELDTIKQIAHVLEDIFKALYNPDVVVDAEVESLLFQAYECLRFPLMAELMGKRTEEQEFLDRAALIIAQLQEKLGDCFDREAPIPNSAELGFDVVQSLFEVGVQQRLQELEHALDSRNLQAVDAELRTKADIFLGLAESLNLPGFGAIAQTTLAALEAHPEQIMEIAKLALADFVQGRTLILAGDRTHGGTPSAALQALAGVGANPSAPDEQFPTVGAEIPLQFAQIPTLDEANLQSSAELENGHTSLLKSASVQSETTVKADVPVASAESLSLDDVFGEMAAAWETSEPETEPEADSAASPTEVSVPYSISPVVSTPIEPPEFPRSEPIRSEPIRISVSSSAESAAEPPRVEPVRVDVEQLKHLDYLAGELLINQSKQTTQDQQLRGMVQELRSSLQQHQRTLYSLQDCVERLMGQAEQGRLVTSLSAVGAALPSAAPLTSTFDVLEMERYSDLRVLVRSALNETVQLDETAEGVDQVTKQSRRSLEAERRLLVQVRDDLTSLRMRPLRDLLNRFPRLLQQLADAHGKQVELILSGTHVLVDKAITERLYDPLLHLIRNAFDHGIEPSEARQSQGKPPIGKIEIRANQQGNQTVIEVKDDGRGINLQQVAQRAIELNLITHEQVSTMPESQLLDVLFQPGFSTVTELSELSGRGVGLDVVNSQLQSMNGSIAVSTAPQQGTTFSLKIPLSLTTTKLLVCQAQGFAYALPVERVEQIIIPTPEQFHISSGEQLVLRWQHGPEEFMVPVYVLSELVNYSDLSSRLGSAATSKIQSTSLRSKQIVLDQAEAAPVLLLQTIYGRRALMVDDVLGEQELVTRSLGAAIAPPPYVYGCCILGSSRSALAIDVEVLMQLTTEVEFLTEHPSPSEASPAAQLDQLLPAPMRSTAARQLAGQGSPFKRAQSKAVLVVDDSFTIRRHLALVFERVGYEVFQAGDGLEALTQLRQHTAINLVVCDIEMPNLNGFEFLGQVQRDPVLAKTPVVMLTSRSSAKHRQIALELGAAAYFTKPYDHNDLVAAVDRLLEQPV
ncbi:hybrid sensor histidine kinase/response regulator [Leptolyngbya sp. FACHB-36]|uniref:hybrid sensor histidine kinase/response regulator n=1 Tax=Leptolyngbya sp. FACHB-36 TaxID=2692808 RepID=UPI001680EF9F|nr:hybrid sensor histidine kinase/response regulator [Leptolyngbya sp. FACHB-36]MBD2022630.1 hybrid sensor histidine kinase/response regulator [Leptolyngbya sp. FACHB-36]